MALRMFARLVDEVSRVTVRPIALFGDPILRTCSTTVGREDPALTKLFADLADTLADFKCRTTWGRGIAANQIGIAKRVIVIDLGTGPEAIFNPVIRWRSNETFEMWDDCFSLPDAMVRVQRPVSITIDYQDETFNPKRMERLDRSMTGLMHHEVDHLDGILMLDRMTDPRLVIARSMRDVAATSLPPPNQKV